jgi:hypothetical protein
MAIVFANEPEAAKAMKAPSDAEAPLHEKGIEFPDVVSAEPEPEEGSSKAFDELSVRVYSPSAMLGEAALDPIAAKETAAIAATKAVMPITETAFRRPPMPLFIYECPLCPDYW